MKVYLDDIRPAPEGWVLVKTAEEAISALRSGKVEEISLDHDLADMHYAGDYSRERTGYDVLTWIEAQVRTGQKFILPVIHIHTMNPVAKKRMQEALCVILKYRK